MRYRAAAVIGWLVIGAVPGCSSSSNPPEIAKATSSTSSAQAPAATPPASKVAGTAPKTAAPSDTDLESEFDDEGELPQRDKLDIFTPSKPIKPVESKPPVASAPPVKNLAPPSPILATPPPVPAEPTPAPLPTVVLLGFLEVEGLRALISVNGEPRVAAVERLEENLEITAIQPPEVSLRSGEQTWTINLFQQPFRRPVASAGRSGAANQLLQTRPASTAPAPVPRGSGDGTGRSDRVAPTDNTPAVMKTSTIEPPGLAAPPPPPPPAATNTVAPKLAPSTGS